MRSFTVPADRAPVRLDVFLAHHLPHGSRRVARRAIAEGAIRVNDRRARKGHMLCSGDVVQVADELLGPPALQANPQLEVPILYEDDCVLALDKPAGMPSHALRARERVTVANFLLARYPETAAVGKSPLEPGIVHRLDTDTSGILLIARNAKAYEALRQQFSAQQVTKEYLALVHGQVTAPGEVRAPIAHDQRSRRMMRVCSSAEGGIRARPAVTYYRPVERLQSATLLSVHIPTGVMHQIRVHLASIGHPIVGDRLYGRAEGSPGTSRHLLHAHRLVFMHPLTGKPTRIICAPPADFRAWASSLAQKKRAPTGSTPGARHGFKRGVSRR